MPFPKTRNLKVAFGACIVTALICVGAVAALPNDKSFNDLSEPATTRPPTCAEREGLPEGVSCSRIAKDYVFAQWLVAWQHGQLIAFYDAVWANHLAEIEAARRPVYSGGEVGECTGFVIPDYIIERESGGSSTAHNPSGAHGCTQTLLSHYSGGACAGLDPYTIQGQRDCTYILSDGGSDLFPWAATR